jgi:hypothetical protein
MPNQIIIICPHCECCVLIMENEVNCAIFRHGVYKNNNKQINPHEKKEICNQLANDNLIYGCGKPFKLIKEKDEYKAMVCEYI